MPELPEVQTVVDDLNAADLVGRKIIGAEVFWPRTVNGYAPEEFCREITGQTVHLIWRRAKYIVIDFLGGKHLLIHFFPEFHVAQ